nr:hypothetical protein [uncultured Desulfuromonas sp.]
MKYLLVVQFDVAEKDDFDSLIELEEKIINSIDTAHEIDGHDFGCDEFNIFIDTNEPTEASTEIQKALNNQGLKRQYKIAYRAVEGDDYKVIYPSDFASEFEIK